ncbi:hypothetical protein AB1E18_012113 [Capra hircus]
MSGQTPPRLVDLAGSHLLRADDLDFPTLESLPTELFPPLFLEAFTGYRTETLKAMVQTWPFVRLPLGALIELPHVGPLQAVLEALDVLLAQKVRSRRCKLRVLDLRNTGQSFWSMWSGASSYGCSGSRMAAVAEPRSTTKQPSTPLKVFIDLCLKKRTLDNFLTYFLRWVEQRKTSVHLCCKKLKIVSMPMDNIVKVLSMVQLDCIQEVQVSCTWNLSTLATFAPLLGEMSNLQGLRLSHVHVSAFKKQEHDHVVQITSQFRRLGHLRDLHLESPSFLEGCLDQMLSLRNPQHPCKSKVLLILPPEHSHSCPEDHSSAVPHLLPGAAKGLLLVFCFLVNPPNMVQQQPACNHTDLDSIPRRVMMSAYDPLRLVNLAAMSLVKDEALAICSLEYLPMELYPPLFMAAFSGRHSEILKAMVQAWPFARLPLGGLMQKPHQGTIQAVLDGLDVLLAQKVHPRRCKLRVLDLRNTGQDFWNMWSGDMDHVPSSSLMAPVAEDMSRTKHPLTPLVVYIELCLKTKTSIKFLTYLLRWVEQRKASMHLCCKKIKIISRSKENIKKILSMVKLNCVQEVELSLTQKLSTLAKFASLLGKMRNVQRLLLSQIHGSVTEEQDHQALLQFTSQILRLQYLRDLRMAGPSFLEGRLNQMLRCLKTSLYNISITNCLLTESDLTHLSQCWNICQLKGLNLNGVTLTNFRAELLQVLLEKVAGTLEELDLNLCGIMDFHLMAILPVLSSCSQLRVLSLCGNLISMTVLESLLRHTDGLSALSLELYPAPRESYSSLGILHQERLAQLKAELWEILTDLGRPRKIWVSPSPCPHCGEDMCYHLSPNA